MADKQRRCAGAGVLLCSLLAAGVAADDQTAALKPTPPRLVYGKAAGEALAMDYYAGAGDGAHPIVITVGAGSTAGLARAGYDVFAINSQQVDGHQVVAAAEDLERAIRYIRFHAREWSGNGAKMAVVSGGPGAYLSVMIGLRNASGIKGSDDAVDRESARLQAAVTVFGSGSADMHAVLDPLIQEKGREAALAQSSFVTYLNPDTPRFLLINGAGDNAVTSAESSELQDSLRKVGLPCDLLPGPNTTDWERPLTEWLNKVLDHKAPVD